MYLFRIPRHSLLVELLERLGESVVVAAADAADEPVRLETWSIRLSCYT